MGFILLTTARKYTAVVYTWVRLTTCLLFTKLQLIGIQKQTALSGKCCLIPIYNSYLRFCNHHLYSVGTFFPRQSLWKHDHGTVTLLGLAAFEDVTVELILS